MDYALEGCSCVPSEHKEFSGVDKKLCRLVLKQRALHPFLIGTLAFVQGFWVKRETTDQQSTDVTHQIMSEGPGTPHKEQENIVENIRAP